MPKGQSRTLQYVEITLDDWIAQAVPNTGTPPLPSEVPEQPSSPPAKPKLPNGDVATPRRCKTECIRLMERLGRVHGRWEVFSSFIKIFAITISNQSDFVHFAERDEILQEEISKYSSEELELFDQIASVLAMAFEFSKEEPCDILGPMFHEMELHNEWNGQFFTPQSVCDMMAMITGAGCAVDMEKGYFTVCEPCCGSGAMIMGIAKVLQQRGLSPQNMVTSATDIDIRCVYMTYIQMSLYGIPAIVTHGNSLTMEQWSCWYTPAYINGDWNARLLADQNAESNETEEKENGTEQNSNCSYGADESEINGTTFSTGSFAAVS